MKTLTKAVSLFVFMFVVSNVQAMSVNMGTLSSPDEFAFASFVKPGSFADEYSFSLTEASSFTAAALQISMDLDICNKSFTILGIDDLSFSLFKGTSGGSNSLVTSSNTPGAFNALWLNAELDASDYFLQISGNSVGKFGGLYALGAVVTPVPEMETWFMMVMGMGWIGYMVKRKQEAA